MSGASLAAMMRGMWPIWLWETLSTRMALVSYWGC